MTSSLKYTSILAMLVIIAAGLFIWFRGFGLELKTEPIASSSEFSISSGAPADQISFIPDGSFVTVRGDDGVFLWQVQGDSLRSRRIFNFIEMVYFLESKPQPVSSSLRSPEQLQTEVPYRPLFTVEPAMFPDASKAVVYHQGILAVFPHDWNGHKDEVQVATIDIVGKRVPIALAVTESGFVAVAYQDGLIEFRKANDISEVHGADYRYYVDNPSAMKVFGDLLHVISNSNSKITVINIKSTDTLTTERSVSFPTTRESDFRLAVSRQGRVAVGNHTKDVFVTASDASGDAYTRWPAYGPVKAFSFLDNDVLVAGGDFQNIYLLEEGKSPTQIAAAERGVSALALSPDRIAYSGDRLVLMSYANNKIFNAQGGAALALAIIAALLNGFAVYRSGVLRPESLSEPSDVPLAAGVSQTQESTRPIPEVPTALVQAIRAGDCVLYCGSGVSAQAGFPYWKPFVQDLTEWVIDSGFVEPSFGASLIAALKQGQYDSVSDNLVSIMRDRQSQLNDYLRETFLKKTTLPDALNLLQGMSLSGVMTTNFDNLLEQAFSNKVTDKVAVAFTPSDAEPLLECLHKREFFLLKLYGKLNEPGTVMLSPSQYDDLVKGNFQFAQFMETLLISRTVFFVGSSLEGIEAYLKGMPLPRQSLRTHYALIPVSGEAWRAKAQPLKERYGIEVLPYSASAGHPEMQVFLQNLDAQVNDATERAPAKVLQGSLLKKISLIDVGPFENLELNFDPHWNILLGDNGTGKSSIIKAIAISILGDDSKAYAQRVIKSGKPNSIITLETGRSIYTTRLFRKNGEARVESIPGRPFEAEGWLAIGFPPLRTVSWVRPTTTETQTRGRPKPEDLLPVVIGEADPRLDKLKQWIVNVDYWIKDAQSRNEPSKQYERLLQDFFHVVSQLTTGTKIEFKEVKAQTKEITIITDDGELPIEALSQGMTSLIGWVGILLQRLYEVYGIDNDDDPKQRYALVLMDEIDAHLHPAWQQSLIRKLSNIFPNVQFVATTHSPLIVGGMKPEQIIRFARDEDDKVVTYKVVEEMTLGRADQILASDLFGLQSTITLNEDLEVLMKEYHELMAKRRNESEESRFQFLRETLKSRIPAAGETPAEQKAMGLIRALLQPDGDGAYSGINQHTLDLAEQLLNEVSKKKK